MVFADDFNGPKSFLPHLPGVSGDLRPRAPDAAGPGPDPNSENARDNVPIEWQNRYGDIMRYILPDGMSETRAEECFRVGSTRRK